MPGGYLAPAGGNEQPAESRPDLLPIEPIDVGVNNALVRVTCPAIKLVRCMLVFLSLSLFLSALTPNSHSSA